MHWCYILKIILESDGINKMDDNKTFTKRTITDDYGESRIIAENSTHVIYKFLDWYQFTNKDNYNARILDARKILKFNRHDGFETLDDCIEYANQYLK